jgi:hypothetical protein
MLRVNARTGRVDDDPGDDEEEGNGEPQADDRDQADSDAALDAKDAAAGFPHPDWQDRL